MTTETKAPGTAIEVVDRVSGEIIDVRTADTAILATFCHNLDQLRADLAEAEAIVHQEIVSRLDKSGEWTRRVSIEGVDGVVKITAPSPTAGTTHVLTDVLEQELDQLVEADVIDRAAAAKALERVVTVTFKVETNEAMDKIVDEAQKDERVVKAEPEKKAVAGGMKQIAKISPKVDRAIKRATKKVPAKARSTRKPKFAIEKRG